MKNKGFTLIELMAIIVILGILAIIIYSSVGVHIASSRIKSYNASTYGLIDVLNRYAIDKKATLTPFSGCSFDFSNETNSCDNLVYNGTLPSDGNVSVDSDGNVNGTIIFDDYVFKIINNEVVLSYKVNDLSGTVYDYSFTGDYQVFDVPFDGYYKVELWGASGGASNRNSNTGGYTSGIIGFNKSLNLYIYIGEAGELSAGTTFNGGGSPGTGLNTSGLGYQGGGATDIRLVSGNWDDFDSLKSRIMVAAGAGGSGWIGYSGGMGRGLAGGLIGYYGTASIVKARAGVFR